ncbi:MAG: hypothetical protein MJZ23_06075 [Paludibacteraceae bacterium]|nr:hypothetical protein [Paludibacteraceae bacterium]
MWTNLLDNVCIKALYGDKVPALDNIDLVMVKIHPSYLTVQLNLFDMPAPIPKRWIEKGYNACSCTLDIYSKTNQLTYKSTNLNISQYTQMSMSISAETDGKKRVEIRDSTNNVFIDVVADGIHGMIGGINRKA